MSSFPVEYSGAVHLPSYRISPVPYPRRASHSTTSLWRSIAEFHHHRLGGKSSLWRSRGSWKERSDSTSTQASIEGKFVRLQVLRLRARKKKMGNVWSLSSSSFRSERFPDQHYRNEILFNIMLSVGGGPFQSEEVIEWLLNPEASPRVLNARLVWKSI